MSDKIEGLTKEEIGNTDLLFHEVQEIYDLHPRTIRNYMYGKYYALGKVWHYEHGKIKFRYVKNESTKFNTVAVFKVKDVNEWLRKNKKGHKIPDPWIEI